MTDRPSFDEIRQIASRVDGVPSVARRSAGPLGVAMAYLPGERVVGVRARDREPIEIHVVLKWGHSVDDAEREVLDALDGLCAPESVKLYVDDIDEAPNLDEVPRPATRRTASKRRKAPARGR